MALKYQLVLLFSLTSPHFSDAFADPVPKPVSKADPAAKADAEAEADAGAAPAIIAHHNRPFLSVTPVPPFIHGHDHSPTPFSTFSHLLSKHNVGPNLLGGYAHPSAAPAYGHPNNPIHQNLAPHPAQAFKYCDYAKPPLCSYNTTKPWCLGDYDYPQYDIEAAIKYHIEGVINLYADVADLSTENSVVRPSYLYEEAYLCPSETAYVRPLRAVNTDGKWRVIVNNIKVDYDVFTQTTRLEECLSYGKPCHLVPSCYESKCVQKSVYHRFLVFDPCDHYFPFAIETFKLPASCSCIVGELYVNH